MFLQISLSRAAPTSTSTNNTFRYTPHERIEGTDLGQLDPDGKHADGDDDPGHLERDLVDGLVVGLVFSSPMMRVQQVDRVGSCQTIRSDQPPYPSLPLPPWPTHNP